MFQVAESNVALVTFVMTPFNTAPLDSLACSCEVASARSVPCSCDAPAFRFRVPPSTASAITPLPPLTALPLRMLIVVGAIDPAPLTTMPEPFRPETRDLSMVRTLSLIGLVGFPNVLHNDAVFIARDGRTVGDADI